ncbi:hypothetical protein AB0M11_31715 [Streptomyces sp. NPDC051987]|uniref:hypothetical protein n=1 Tax=Streptomyces sp. NPDC051987 TaxID=3155808 RepID=UPI0034480E2D
MSTDDPAVPGGRPYLQRLRERCTEHHRQARVAREETDLAEAVETAAFDLGADIAHPAPAHAEAAYDIDTDLGAGPRQPPSPALSRPAVRSLGTE